jgi:hypothetical protein
MHFASGSMRVARAHFLSLKPFASITPVYQNVAPCGMIVTLRFISAQIDSGYGVAIGGKSESGIAQLIGRGEEITC